MGVCWINRIGAPECLKIRWKKKTGKNHFLNEILVAFWTEILLAAAAN